MLLVEIRRREVPLNKLDERAMENFQTFSSMNAQIVLNSPFERNRLKVSVPAAVDIILLYGIFLWINSMIPIGIVASVLTMDYILQNYLLHKYLVLDYLLKFEMSSSFL